MKQKQNHKQKPLLLIVDDNPRNLQLIGSILYKENYQISMAENGYNALKLLENIKPDLIILDISMPGKDGFEVCTDIKSNPNYVNIPIIFLTAKNNTKDLLHAFEVGGVDYITKPFDQLELIARIKTHLDLKFSRELIEKSVKDIEEANAKLINLNLLKDRYLSILKTDLASASNYVKSLLPAFIDTDHIKAEWLFAPSAELGGDSFGYHWIDSEHFAIYLLDVSGHGVSSALESVSVQNMLRQQTLPKTDFRNPEKVFTSLNKVYQMNEHNNNYFTIWYGVFHRSSRKLKFCSAGHPSSILIDSQGQVLELNNRNHPVGFLPDSNFTGDEYNGACPFHLFVFSDGVYELQKNNKLIWSYDSFKLFLADAFKNNDNELKLIYDHVKNNSTNNKLQDDFSILKISFK